MDESSDQGFTPPPEEHDSGRFPRGVGFVIGCAIAVLIVIVLLYRGGAFHL